MSSTNKTTNYNSSQYIGSDKPTYLGDYNSDMQKIDTAMKNNADNIQAVGSTANTASENANTALENAQNAQNTANSAQGTATSALTKATQNEIGISKFNFTNFETFGASDMTTNRGTIRQSAFVQIASNSDGSIGKIYGDIFIDNVQQPSGQPSEFYVVIPNTKLRPSSLINIKGCSLRSIYTNDGFNDFMISSYSIAPNGTVTLQLYSNSSVTSTRVSLLGCLLFLKDFGDVPAPEQ